MPELNTTKIIRDGAIVTDDWISLLPQKTVLLSPCPREKTLFR